MIENIGLKIVNALAVESIGLKIVISLIILFAIFCFALLIEE